MMEKVLSPAAYRSLAGTDRALVNAAVAPFLSARRAKSARALAELPSHRERLFDTFDALSDGIAAFTLEGLLVHRNRALAELLCDTSDSSALLNAMSNIVAVLREGHQSPLAARGAGTAPVSRQVEHEGERIHVRGCMLPGQGERREALALVTVVNRPHPRPKFENARERTRAQYNLTGREVEVTMLLAQRMSNREIALRLGLSEHTARHHTERILRKLGAVNRREVAKLVRSARGERTR